MSTYKTIDEKYKDRLLDSILERLNKIDRRRWNGPGTSDEFLTRDILGITRDIKNLQKGIIANYLLSEANPSIKSKQLFKRKTYASIKRIKYQTTVIKNQLIRTDRK